jgi:PAS domain S-box-containing protein
MDEASATRSPSAWHGGSAAGAAAERPEALLREVIERTARLGSWQWWPGRNEARWSRNLYLLLGLDPAGAPVGFDQCHTLFVGDSWPRLRQAVLAAIDGGGQFELELEFVRADRSTGWASLLGQALADAAGRTEMLIGTFQDISERKRVDIALRTSEARMRALFESAGDALIVTDTSMKIVMANPAAARMHRCTLDHLVGTLFHTWIPRRHHRLFAGELLSRGHEVLASLQRGQNEGLTALRADGQEFPIEITLSQMHVDGQRFYAAAGRDLSETMQIQHALQRSRNDLRKLIARAQSVEEHERRRIARDLHDELQQPLAAMKMMALGIAGRTRAPPLSRQASELAAMADKAIAATRRIVNDLRPLVLDDLGLVAALELMASGFARHSGVQVTYEALGADGADAALPADLANCLYRVTQESLNNIHKHAQAHRVQLCVDLSVAGQVRLSVSDDGKGIQAQDLKRSGAFGVLGMDERVQALGGSLRVAAAEGGGTCVEAVLPLHGSPG